MKRYNIFRWLDFRNWSFTVRLTAIMIFLVTITLSGATWITIRTVQSVLTNQIGENLGAEAVSTSNRLTAFFVEKVAVLQGLTAVDLIKDSLAERNKGYSGTPKEIKGQLQAIDAVWSTIADDDPFVAGITTADPKVNPNTFQLMDFHETFEDYVEIFVTDRYGATVAATSKPAAYYHANEAWWQAAWNDGLGAVYISEPKVGRNTLTVAVPVIGEETGKAIGIIHSTLDVSELFEMVNRVKIGQTGHAVLLNGLGKMLYDPNAKGRNYVEYASHLQQHFVGTKYRAATCKESQCHEPAHLQQHLMGEDFFSIVSVDQYNNPSIFGHTSFRKEDFGSGVSASKKQILEAIANLGWVTVIQQETDEAFASVNQIVQGGVMVGAIAVVLASTLAMVGARTVTRPLITLGAAAEQIGIGNLDTPLPPARHDEIGRLTVSFENMTVQLRDLISNLERRVAARTRRLEIIANLSEHLSAILNLEELLIEVVNQVKEAFGYYYVHIYLLDDQREKLIVAQGTGEAGQVMKDSGHNIPLNAPTSLVARAARSGEIVSISNVREEKNWLPNPLLPDTYSEMAVPIFLEGEVVGVLDVQENKVGGLDEGDANLLRSLANQVAVAIRNAHLFARVETALAEAHAAQERYVEQAWKRANAVIRGGQHHYTCPGVPALDDFVLIKAKQQALVQNQPAVVTLNGNGMGSKSNQEGSDNRKSKTENPKSIVSPIAFRNKNIGVLQLHPISNDQIWTEDDLAIVEAVVDQLAQTAESLRLFEDTRERAGREQVVREITEKMQAAVSLEDLIKTTAEELGHYFSLEYAAVELGIEEEQ